MPVFFVDDGLCDVGHGHAGACGRVGRDKGDAEGFFGKVVKHLHGSCWQEGDKVGRRLGDAHVVLGSDLDPFVVREGFENASELFDKSDKLLWFCALVFAQSFFNVFNGILALVFVAQRFHDVFKRGEFFVDP